MFTSFADITMAHEQTEAIDVSDEETIYADYIKTISNLGIMVGYEDGTFRPQQGLTRAEFVTIIVRILGMGNVIGETNKGVFDDVPEDAWYAGYVSIAHDLQIVNGTSENLFSPNDNLNGYQAVKMLISAMGYKTIAESSGGYPFGYVAVANSLKIHKGVSINEKQITRGEISRLIYNALEVEFAEILSYPHDGTFVNNGRTILSSMGFKIAEGRLNAHFGMSLVATDFTVARDEVVVGNELYKIKTDDYERFLACNIKLYYKEEEGRNVIYSIIPSKNYDTDDKISVESDDIDDATTLSTFVYRNGSNKTKKIDLPDDIIIIYNGKEVPTIKYVDEILKPEDGSVTLIKNGGTEYCYAVVRNAKNYFVNFAEYPYVNDVYGSALKLEAEDDKVSVSIFDENGKKTDFSAIKPNDVLSVYKSFDNESISVYLSRTIITGELVSKSSDSGEITFDIDDGTLSELKLSKEYSNGLLNGKTDTIGFGEIGQFFINSSGKIVYSILLGEGEQAQYAYLLDSHMDSGIRASVSVKLLTKNNKFENYEICDKVIFGRKEDSDYIVGKEDSSLVYEVINRNAVTVRQLVKYATDDEGKIKKIYLADTKNPASEFSTHTDRNVWYYKNGLLDNTYVLNEKTTWIDIPYQGKYDDLLSCGAPSKFLKNGSSYTLDLFDVKDGVVGSVVCWSDVAHFDTYQTKVIIDKVNSPVMIIDKCYGATIDGVDYNLVAGYVGGEYKAVPLSNELSSNPNILTDLKRGRVIQYETNYLDLTRAETSEDVEVMWLYTVLHDLTTDSEPYIKWNYTNIFSTEAEICTLYGTVVACDGRFIEVNIDGKSYKFNLGTGCETYKYDYEIQETQNYAICPGMQIFMRLRYNNVIEVVIVEM